KVYEVSGRDVDGLHARLRPQRRAYRLTRLRVNERRAAAALLARLVVPADEDGFRAAERRAVNQQTDVARDAEAPGVRVALPVEHQRVRLGLQLRPGFQDGRRLAERQKPR